MQRKEGPPHPGAVLPGHIQILAEKQKLQHRAPYKQESANPFHHASIRDQMDPVCKKKLACRTPPFERTLIHYATRDGKEAEDGGQKGGFAP